ncbi:MAG: AmmeMemoRadiSam system protein B [Bacteroidales bacterium]|nr:AmmeMemoRadiSam system protein B [Lentimicrobiaceae bacterium]MDD5695912.1 AmmeMemoRadiSam system protein B [Bacteroidales bacterium]
MTEIKIACLLFSLFLTAMLSLDKPASSQEPKIRQPVDTVGFAHLDWQMDSIMTRIMRLDFNDKDGIDEGVCLLSSCLIRLAISPHDDYTYVGKMYPVILSCIKAKTIVLFGVAHKAKQLGLENVLVFDSYDSWQGPYGPVKISSAREELMQELSRDLYQVNDSMQAVEHSVEALIPFLQYLNKEVEIVPILVPYMSFERMEKISQALAEAIDKVSRKNAWKWGNNLGIMISSDAVHYGDEDWGDSNYAFYGTDSSGYQKAVAHEWEIIRSISGELNPESTNRFMNYTVQENDYKAYKWTWCGRYAIPMGLLTSYYLSQQPGQEPLFGIPVGYQTSIDHDPLKVDDLRMGVTAPATMRHWVGYAGVVYK